MTAPYLQGSAAVPEATALLLRGVQTDAYGEIKGGHKALFDFMQSGLTGKLANGASVPNLVTGGAAAIATYDFLTAANIEAAKGLNFTLDGGLHERLELPSVFNFLNLGSEPSLVLSMWLTQTATPAGNDRAIGGYSYLNSTYNQWLFSAEPDGLKTNINGTALTGLTVTNGVPVLVTLHANRTGSGTFRVNAYKNAALHAGINRTYPFFDPLGGSGTTKPQLGPIFGHSSSWEGTIHRLQLIKVIQDFDIGSWLAAEIAANAGRWA